MIAGHPYLSTVIPPAERIPIVVLIIISAMVISYLGVKAFLMWADWRYNYGVSRNKKVD